MYFTTAFQLITMAKNCEKCSLSIKVECELYTVCEGNCAKWFHADCVGLTENDLCALSSNIVWICDACMVLFCRMREKTNIDAATNTECSRPVEEEINDLKCAVAKIADMLSNVIQKPTTTAAPPHHSTLVSSSELLSKTNDEISCEPVQHEPNNSLHALGSETFAVYLSNIDKCVTENDISVMVSRSLRAPLSCCNDVVRLVPKHKNTNTLDYVSFKVVLEASLKPLALSASTWPRQIKFREFKNRMNETWKPSE